MGAFADSLFAVLMSWVRALVNSIWALFTSERTTLLEFLGKNWIGIVVVLIAAGLVIDWLIWLIRWRPYTLWAQRARKALHIAPKDDWDEEDEEEEAALREAAYTMRAKAYAPEQEEYLPEEDDEDWLPEQPVFEEADEEAAMERAQAVPDEELGVYPGMRFDETARYAPQPMDSTRRLGAVHQEGPGAAEVSRRRAEIDAWQEQLRQQEQAQREARMAQMRREEEERLANERRAEQERLAQEEYARQLEQYELEKARYEQEMEQYRRDMAAYEAALAAQRADEETAQEIAPERTGRTRSRRRSAPTYSDLVGGEEVDALPQSPQWPRMDAAVSAARGNSAENRTEPPKKPARQEGLIGKMAQLIEPEKEEISGVNALPPRVKASDAYRPAAQPETKRRRK